MNELVQNGAQGDIRVRQSTQAGKSIIFMLESNPGLGILLAGHLAGTG